MAEVTICSDFGAPPNKVCHCFHCFSVYLLWSDGTSSTWGQTMVEVMKIMVTSFERSHACTTATLSAPNPAAGHHWTTPLLETPGHSLYLHKVHFKFWIWRLCFWKKKWSSFSLLILVIFHSGTLIRQMLIFVYSPLNNHSFIFSIPYLFYILVIQ